MQYTNAIVISYNSNNIYHWKILSALTIATWTKLVKTNKATSNKLKILKEIRFIRI